MDSVYAYSDGSFNIELWSQKLRIAFRFKIIRKRWSPLLLYFAYHWWLLQKWRWIRINLAIKNHSKLFTSREYEFIRPKDWKIVCLKRQSKLSFCFQGQRSIRQWYQDTSLLAKWYLATLNFWSKIVVAQSIWRHARDIGILRLRGSAAIWKKRMSFILVSSTPFIPELNARFNQATTLSKTHHSIWVLQNFFQSMGMCSFKGTN